MLRGWTNVVVQLYYYPTLQISFLAAWWRHPTYSPNHWEKKKKWTIQDVSIFFSHPIFSFYLISTPSWSWALTATALSISPYSRTSCLSDAMLARQFIQVIDEGITFSLRGKIATLFHFRDNFLKNWCHAVLQTNCMRKTLSIQMNWTCIPLEAIYEANALHLS